MTRKGGLVAAAVVVVINALTLWAVWANRSGEPEAALELTERELSLPPREAENTALALRLEWVDPQVLRPGPDWFDRRKLEEVGFDCRLPVTLENRDHFRGQAPRKVFAVLEYEGDMWQRYLADSPPPSGQEWVDRRRAVAEPAARVHGSHLVVIDVGNVAAALRERYPDRKRQVIVPATASLVYREGSGSPYLEGRVTTVLPPQINVTREHRKLLETLQSEGRPRALPAAARQDDAAHPPRFTATVKWGRNLEPWLADVRPIGR